MSHHDLDLDQTMPNVKLVRANKVHILQYVQVSSGLIEPLLFELSCSHTHTHTHTHTLF